ncbi:MAG: hypothetical protein JWQ09_2993 [Segetibacter sp.]|nr:hypothetical protein [Segetibacter sp.]
MNIRQKKYGVFISYSHQDAKFVNPIVSLISAVRPDLVFQDTKELKHGKKWQPKLTEALMEADIIIVFWCKHSAKSTYVQKEYEDAINYNKDVLPVLLDNSSLNDVLSKYQWIDFKEAISHEVSNKKAPLTLTNNFIIALIAWPLVIIISSVLVILINLTPNKRPNVPMASIRYIDTATYSTQEDVEIKKKIQLKKSYDLDLKGDTTVSHRIKNTKKNKSKKIQKLTRKDSLRLLKAADNLNKISGGTKFNPPPIVLQENHEKEFKDNDKSEIRQRSYKERNDNRLPTLPRWPFEALALGILVVLVFEILNFIKKKKRELYHRNIKADIIATEITNKLNEKIPRRG